MNYISYLYIMKDLRTEKIQLVATEKEKKIIDAFRDKLQLVTPRQKVSRVDAILKAIDFANGKIF